MRIGISTLGIENHQSVLDEEKRQAAALHDMIEQISVQARIVLPAAAAEWERIGRKVETLSKSIRSRGDFLNGLVEETLAQEKNTEDVLTQIAGRKGRIEL